ncbi:MULTISPECIES: head maturation protease, ClpP-related [unclassified Pseudovibrio]|uniref:head maturation protease, ClpP-related n=1 Tax=unclassified Pseudovibrio TaxID=2627060 RepID=UPI0007AE7CF4|nr:MULTISPECIES: head maturation protease, ClpP-related [unclassified Pseudovibrio]KZL00497.1 ATP-dependent Clp protease proteolytic subunit [Pseudovibrio sp. W74]KZL07673.1 ATP-dependent Clp protease proteolytic subunit [Pseudovibrio sp. Ad14]
MSLRNLPTVPLSGRQGLQSTITDSVLQRWNPDLKVASSSENENSISILDPIGESWMYDGVTAKRIAAALRNIGEKDVVVSINSPGGDFFEGLAIYNLLREHKAKVTVKVLGLAASSASIIAMAADEIQIGRAAFFMIHNTWVCACGDRHAFREVSDWLEPFDAAAVSIYHARTSILEKELEAQLDKETWINGESAVEQGFADALLAADEAINEPTQVSRKPSPNAAQKELDILLVRLNIPKSKRRSLCAALKGSTSGAAPNGKSGAAVHPGVKDLLDKINSI